MSESYKGEQSNFALMRLAWKTYYGLLMLARRLPEYWHACG